MLDRSLNMRPLFRRTVVVGLVGGVVAAVVMAVFAMVAGATFQHHGFFTPMYHIATLILNPVYLMTSARNAGAGDAITWFPGAAVLGFAIHLAVGAAYGLVFALLVRAVGLKGGATVPAGLVFGGAVVLFSTFVGLPVAATVFDAGEPIRKMTSLAGWVTFTVEHAIFGLVVGIAVAAFLRPAARGTGLPGEIARAA